MITRVKIERVYERKVKTDAMKINKEKNLVKETNSCIKSVSWFSELWANVMNTSIKTFDINGLQVAMMSSFTLHRSRFFELRDESKFASEKLKDSFISFTDYDDEDDVEWKMKMMDADKCMKRPIFNFPAVAVVFTSHAQMKDDEN